MLQNYNNSFLIVFFKQQYIELISVIPVYTGIQNTGRGLDSHFRGNDGHLGIIE